MDVNYRGFCLKLQKEMIESDIKQITDWFKAAIDKIHEEYTKNMEDTVKDLTHRLYGNYTGEVYGRGPEDLTSTDINSKLTSTDIK